MVNWHRLEVPRLEWHLVDALGALRSNGEWWCTRTQFRSKDFKRFSARKDPYLPLSNPLGKNQTVQDQTVLQQDQA